MKTFLLDVLDIAKPRIVLLSTVMAALGYGVATAPMPFNGVELTAMCVGLILIGSACGALNHYLEKDIDAKMLRTQSRPLPAGRLSPRFVLGFGVLTALLGEAILLGGVNAITAVLGGLTILFYLGIYTPAKRVSSLSTLVGAVPGAMPPLMGTTAALGKLSLEGIFLFFILFLWQIPHFLAIAWLYRDDYARAGLPILSVVDPEGIATAKQAVIYSAVLLPLSLLPSLWGLTGARYFMGALLLGTAFIATGLLLAIFRTRQSARRLFVVSIVYLPALAALMWWDRAL